MHKIRDFVNNLNKDELEHLDRSLQSGVLSKIVEKKMKEVNSGLRICPVCSSDVGKEAYVLIFGPQGLRKKAAFCAYDCLEYFISYLKKEKKEAKQEHR